MSDFVHLHCHTEYSLLDGAIRIRDLCARAKDLGMESVAITDHGNLYGSLRFYLEAGKLGLKPIIGCEMYVTEAELGDRESALAKTRYHLVLLAQNIVGYRNLVKLVSAAHLRGFYSKPRINKELLREYNEGLIAMSACLAGEVPVLLRSRGQEAAEKRALEYADIFPERFYLELQSNGLAEQQELNTALIELSAKTSLPLVATNDCHYLSADDVEAHDLLLCIQTATTLDDPKRMRFETRELYYKTPEEMEQAFAHVPQAIENTARIAAMCDLELDLGKHHFPVYSLPEGRGLEEEFAAMCRKGLSERLDKLPYAFEEQLYRERLEHEIEVIIQMGFAGYFLIVQDFINWAKSREIPVGPGRGSAAGSLVAFALKITNLDPVPYNLLFERFLNQERVSLPDIDVDFCERRRGEVIRYVCERYGEENVAQITTFGTMKAKAVVRDVGRALGMSFSETDRIAKLIPGDLKMTIDKALELEPELRKLADEDATVGKLLDVSRRLEGLCRHASTHAAGVVIGDRPLTEYLPLYRGKRDEVVTQLDMKMVEKTGLIKFDFLGLRNMTMIQDTLDLIAAQGRVPPDLETLPLDDPEVYALYSRADTDGVFQVESSGMRRYLRQLKPSCFDDIIAMLALYRPGPLGSGMVEQFIRRKQGEEAVVYPVDSLEPVLKDTYGVIVYQEQVMKIAQVIAGYTLGGADLLRRAMGKKDRVAMTEQRARFLEGAARNGLERAKAVEIFDLMEKFAEYGFNKSHSAAYALISYYTAYLKAHYPAEFMAALMTSEKDNQDKLLIYLNSCREMNLQVSPPDINAGQAAFVVKDGKILFGLSGVKNVGREAIEEIVANREKNGPFTSLLDLCCRLNLRKVSKRVLDSLIKSGALDCLGCARAAFFVALDDAVARAQKKSRAADASQASLLSFMPQEAVNLPGIGWDGPEKDTPEWDDEVKMAYEKESLGFYLSSHPLLPYRNTIKRNGWLQLVECRDKGRGDEVEMAVMITGHKDHINRKGDRMAFCQIEDLTGTAEIVVFSDLYQTARSLWELDRPLLLRAVVNAREGGEEDDDDSSAVRLKLAAKNILPLSEAVRQSQATVSLGLSTEHLADGGIKSLKEFLLRHKGNSVVQVQLNLDGVEYKLRLGEEYGVMAGPAFEKAFRAWKVGENNVGMQ